MDVEDVADANDSFVWGAVPYACLAHPEHFSVLNDVYWLSYFGMSWKDK